MSGPGLERSFIFPSRHRLANLPEGIRNVIKLQSLVTIPKSPWDIDINTRLRTPLTVPLANPVQSLSIEPLIPVVQPIYVQPSNAEGMVQVAKYSLSSETIWKLTSANNALRRGNFQGAELILGRQLTAEEHSNRTVTPVVRNTAEGNPVVINGTTQSDSSSYPNEQKEFEELYRKVLKLAKDLHISRAYMEIISNSIQLIRPSLDQARRSGAWQLAIAYLKTIYQDLLNGKYSDLSDGDEPMPAGGPTGLNSGSNEPRPGGPGSASPGGAPAPGFSIPVGLADTSSASGAIPLGPGPASDGSDGTANAEGKEEPYDAPIKSLTSESTNIPSAPPLESMSIPKLEPPLNEDESFMTEGYHRLDDLDERKTPSGYTGMLLNQINEGKVKLKKTTPIDRSLASDNPFAGIAKGRDSLKSASARKLKISTEETKPLSLHDQLTSEIKTPRKLKKTSKPTKEVQFLRDSLAKRRKGLAGSDEDDDKHTKTGEGFSRKRYHATSKLRHKALIGMTRKNGRNTNTRTYLVPNTYANLQESNVGIYPHGIPLSAGLMQSTGHLAVPISAQIQVPETHQFDEAPTRQYAKYPNIVNNLGTKFTPVPQDASNREISKKDVLAHPFGRFYVDSTKFHSQGIFSMHNAHKKKVHGVPNIKLTKPLYNALQKVINGGKVNHKSLDAVEKITFSGLCHRAGVKHPDVSVGAAVNVTPEKQLQIILGEKDAGNNNPILTTQLKKVLGYMTKNKILRKEQISRLRKEYISKS